MKTKIYVLIAIGMLLANIPMALVLLTKAGQEKDFERLEHFALAYEQALDKEKYMADIYNDVRHVDESRLPPHLQRFIIRVKVSQFGK